MVIIFFFFSSRRRHTRWPRDWSSDVCSSDLDKLGVIANLITKADRLLIGGGMVFTFLAAKGYRVGNSLLEEDQVDTVKGYLETAADRGVQIVLPTPARPRPAGRRVPAGIPTRPGRRLR